MTRYAKLADGRVLAFPDDTPNEVVARVAKEQTLAGVKEDAGFFGSYGETATTLGAAPQAAAFAADPNDVNRKALIEATKSKYRHTGFGEGNNWEAFKEILGNSLGQITAPALAATGAAAVTGGVGAIPAGYAVNATQYEIQGLARQAQEQQAAIDRGEKVSFISPVKNVFGA